MVMKVYLDNNAATRVDDEVIDYMIRFFKEDYAVASSQFSHSPGIIAKSAVEEARNNIASSIYARGSDRIVFTSGAAEANNLAIKGAAYAQKKGSRKKILVLTIDEFSVLHSCRSLESFGFTVEKVKVDGEGFIDLDHLSSLVDENTLLVSAGFANHEVGTIQDMSAIAGIVHSKGALLHTDASYAYLQIPIDVRAIPVDLMTLSAYQVHGPKGIGALYIRKGTDIEKIQDGGFQEYDLRAGIENVPLIAGFGKAVQLYNPEDVVKTAGMRDLLYEKLTGSIDNVLLNGASNFTCRTPGNLNVSFSYIEGESVVLHLDMRGIAVITGSACFSRALEASHVLLGMGFTHERAHGSIRFSLSKYNTFEEIEYTVDQVKEVVEKLRALSPLQSLSLLQK